MERNRRKWKEEREAKEMKQTAESLEGHSITSHDNIDDSNLEGRTSGDCNGSSDSDNNEVLSEATPSTSNTPSPPLPANDSRSS